MTSSLLLLLIHFAPCQVQGDLPELKPPLYILQPFTLENVMKYAATGVELLEKNSPGYMWMYRAVADGKPDIVEFLLRKGRSADDLLWFDTPALYWLAYHSWKPNADRVKVADLLLRYGADLHGVSPQDHGAGTALHALAWFGDPSLARFLIARGISREFIDANGQTALIRAFEPLRPTLGGNFRPGYTNLEMIRTLIEAGCDPTVGGHKPSPYSIHNSGVTPLHIAAYVGLCDIVKLMVRVKWYRDAVTEVGQAPLHVAVLKEDNVEMVKLLLQLGASRKLRDKNGETALDIARRKGFAEIEAVLK